MTHPCRSTPLLVALVPLLGAGLLLAAPEAQAQRVSRATAAMQQAVQQAKARFDAAQEDDEARQAALAQVEQAIAECGRQRGCEVGEALPVYRQMLAGEAEAVDESFDDDEDLIDTATYEDVPVSATAAALLDERNRRFVEGVQFNPAVQAGIRKWLTDWRGSLIESYVNYQYMRHLMWPEFEKRGLPEALLFGIMTKESNGKVHVGSRAGAIGPMQFMPATGRRFGLGNDGTGFDTRYDPAGSARAAAEYLLERNRELGGNIEMALAAYNGGEGRALRIHRASGGRSFWDGAIYDQFPAETRDYVPMVIAAAWLFLHADDYGLRWPRVYNRATQVRLQQPSSLHELTICLGNSRTNEGYLRALRNLNPRLQPSAYLPAGTSINLSTTMGRLYERYCRPGTRRAEMAKRLVGSVANNAVVRVGTPTVTRPVAGTASAPVAAAPTPRPAAPSRPTSHRVAPGENLTQIARRYECSVGALVRANALRSPSAIRPGQVLKLEGCGG